MIFRRTVLLFFLLSYFLFPLSALCQAIKLTAAIKRDVPLSKNTGLVVVDVATGQELFSRNEAVPLKPASVLKILTSDVAFQKLGAEHVFKTEFYGKGFSGSKVDTLAVKGYGDPSFVQEQLWISARKVYLRGVRVVRDLVVDDSAFVNARERQGQRAYQAGASALAFNFNSIPFEVCPTTTSSAARIMYDPFEYPLRISGKIKTVSKGSSTYQIDETPARQGQIPGTMSFLAQGKIRRGHACTSILRSVEDPALYAGYALKGFLEQLGIKVSGEVRRGRVPAGSGKIYTHFSKQLAQIIRDLNHYSSNFIAEQLLMAIGKRKDGAYDRTVGIKELEKRLLELGEAPDQFVIDDASGLSHENRITTRALSKILISLRLDQKHGVEFVNSLAVDSRRGTLRKRALEGTVRAKTGTINGVGTLAGFVTSREGREYGFVLLQNKVSSRAKASTIEKKLIRTLYRS